MDQSALDRKRNGIHYTPVSLANFLADQIWQIARANPMGKKKLRILDPACGDGQLLCAMARSVESDFKLELVGFETDPVAAELARQTTGSLGNVDIYCEDFLEFALSDKSCDFDIVISNPPYVRTQNLDNHCVDRLRDVFQLSGRLDLYQAFTIAMSRKLAGGGTLGLLTSNRFMYVRSGQTMRRFLAENFQMHRVFDLGDTKQFSAAVLPAIVIATKSEKPVEEQNCPFVRVQSNNATNDAGVEPDSDFFDLIADPTSGHDGRYSVERGMLNATDCKQPWSILNDTSRNFLEKISIKKCCTFADVAEIKVGIKTTADSVFIREDWNHLSKGVPESPLLRPLITHHVCRRWRSLQPQKQVLYPYSDQSKRETVNLDRFPIAKSYLSQHYEQLNSRRYLKDAGRKWFEIWVPQQPSSWQYPKVVWPDISERPTFSIDNTGAIVNGDCYWIKLKPELDPDWLYLILGVANSSVAEQFYDVRFHNKLYARRRRFMTQYVNEFPLPDLELAKSRGLITLIKNATKLDSVEADLESDIDERVRSILS